MVRIILHVGNTCFGVKSKIASCYLQAILVHHILMMLLYDEALQ
jgi:hypothetical protein